MSKERGIALFGGTFDPVHEGHLAVAQKAVSHLGLEKIIFIPCRRSPHKSEAPGASDSDRLQMLKRATEDLNWAEISDFELQKPPPSFTWETVSHFKGTLPARSRLYLLIGFDQWENLPRWQHPEIIARQVQFIVVGRSGQPKPRPGYQAHFIKGNHPASASEIRRDLLAQTTPRWLPHKVFEYISKKDLYSRPR